MRHRTQTNYSAILKDPWPRIPDSARRNCNKLAHSSKIALSWLDSCFPPPVHPDTLFGVTQQHPFERSIVGAGILPDRFARVFALDEGERFFKAQDMRAVRLAPTGGRDDRRFGAQSENRQALERPGRMTKKV